MNRACLISTLALLGAFAAACGEEPPKPAAAKGPKPAAAADAPAPSKAAAAADAGTAAGPEYLYAYNPMGKRDPFRTFVVTGPKSVDVGCNEPLCLWNLEQLSLVAVVSGEANPMAMMEDPQRIGHVARRNTRVGKQGGKVTQILRDCIVVTEYWMSPDGKYNPNPVKLCVKTDKRYVPVPNLLNPQERF